MLTTNPYLLQVHSNYQQQRLQSEAVHERLLKQLSRLRSQEAKPVATDQSATSLITWRRRWQHLLVGTGLLATLLINW